jgi:hypothetical protein
VQVGRQIYGRTHRGIIKSWCFGVNRERLSDDMRPGDVAQTQGVALSTVLSHVASIRTKTTSASLQDLLLTLARLPGLREAIV